MSQIPQANKIAHDRFYNASEHTYECFVRIVDRVEKQLDEGERKNRIFFNLFRGIYDLLDSKLVNFEEKDLIELLGRMEYPDAKYRREVRYMSVKEAKSAVVYLLEKRSGDLDQFSFSF